VLDELIAPILIVDNTMGMIQSGFVDLDPESSKIIRIPGSRSAT
jgi:hypothetical protein